MSRILVIEDNADLAYGLRNNLEIEGYVVEVADDGSRRCFAARGRARGRAQARARRTVGWTSGRSSASDRSR